MGCWLETCAISGLPIKDKDKVKCLILVSSPCTPVGRMFEVTNLAFPFCFPIDGKYNGYGSINCNKSKTNKVILDYFNGLIANKMIIDYSKKIKNIEKLLSDLESERIIIKREVLNWPEDIALALFMIHENIYNLLINSANKVGDFKISTIMNCYNINNKNNINGDNGNEVDFSHFYKSLYEFEAKSSPIFTLYENSIKNGKINKSYINKEIINYYKLLESMSGLRKMFQSHLGAGSQYFNYKLFNKIQKESRNLIKKA